MSEIAEFAGHGPVRGRDLKMRPSLMQLSLKGRLVGKGPRTKGKSQIALQSDGTMIAEFPNDAARKVRGIGQNTKDELATKLALSMVDAPWQFNAMKEIALGLIKIIEREGYSIRKHGE